MPVLLEETILLQTSDLCCKLCRKANVSLLSKNMNLCCFLSCLSSNYNQPDDDSWVKVIFYNIIIYNFNINTYHCIFCTLFVGVNQCANRCVLPRIVRCWSVLRQYVHNPLFRRPACLVRYQQWYLEFGQCWHCPLILNRIVRWERVMKWQH